MKNTILDSSIGSSIIQYPSLVKIFLDNKVDFCCGGDRTLRIAVSSDSDNPSDVINLIAATIDEEKATQTQYTLEDVPGLIHNIKITHHKYLKDELPIISGLLFKLIDVHGKSHPELFKLHKIFGELRLELESHLIKEEQDLFPHLLENSTFDSQLIETLYDEHDQAGDALHAILEVTDHLTIPSDACPTYTSTYQKLGRFIEDMYHHVHKENNILFKMIERKDETNV